MNILNQIFMVAGLGIAFYFGYAGFKWFFILISGIILTLGWVVVRLGAIYTVKQSAGFVGLIRLFSIQIIIMSIIAGMVFFIGYLFS